MSEPAHHYHARAPPHFCRCFAMCLFKQGISMIDPKELDPRLAVQFIARARRASTVGQAAGSVSERIVTAFLCDRSDWLPAPYQQPLAAVAHLHAENAVWFHTMLAVSKRNWRGHTDMHEERLS